MAFIKLEDLEEKEIVPGYKARFIHSENVTIAHWNIKAGYSLPDHSHVHEMFVNVIEGEFELTVDGEAKILKPGEAAFIPSNVPHSGRSITDCRLIDVFYPVREDYK